VATCTGTGAAHLVALAEAGRGGDVHLVYHGLDLARFGSPSEAPNYCGGGVERDGTSPERSVRLLSVGRAVNKKGFDLLIDALAIVPKQFHWHWTHIGGGGLLADLKAQAHERGIDDRITWLGVQEQRAVMAACRANDIFVLPCRIDDDGDRDGMPNVLMEAQSQGLACLSTRVSAIPELIENGRTGVLVEPEDVDALASAILQLGGNPAYRGEIARAGEARVRSEFDHRSGLRQLADLFEDAMAKQASQ
ncbi:MAG: glycosyltransferase, partial [Pseudomonadota bacterium]